MDTTAFAVKIAGKSMTSPARPIRLLFICSQNRLRSPTAEKLFDGSARYMARSAGASPSAVTVLTGEHIAWADTVFCMEKDHVDHLMRRFPGAIRGKRIVCLGIPDRFAYMDQELVELLHERLAPYVEVSSPP